MDIKQYLPINGYTTAALCESGLHLTISQVRCDHTEYGVNFVYDCVTALTGETLTMITQHGNSVSVTDENGYMWRDELIAVEEDGCRKIYTPDAHKIMHQWISETNRYGLIATLLTIATVAIILQDIYVAIPFIGVTLLAFIGWRRHYLKVDRCVSAWCDRGLFIKATTAK